MGDNMFRLKDRWQHDLCLGMTHEEIMTVIARGELRSYKQLPQIWYQIQTKFRDEPRPKSGLLRVRQFIMKDSYSFDMDAAGLDAAYEKHYEAYCRIFDRCGLKYVAVEAHSGAMGGSQSHEFMVATDAGEDLWPCAPAAATPPTWRRRNREPVPPLAADPEGDLSPEKFHTPGRKTIAEVAEFTGSSRNLADEEPGHGGRRGAHAGSGARRSQPERDQSSPAWSAPPRSGPPTRRRSASGSAPTPVRSARWASAACASSPTWRSRAAAT